MPIVVGSTPSTPGAGAQILGSPTICTFGGLALPNGQGTLSNINLNDTINWFLQDLRPEEMNRQIGMQQLVTRGRSVYVSDDFNGKTISLPMRFRESATLPLGAALARLSQAGEQQLSFDGLTYTLAKYKGVQSRQLLVKYAPYLWEFTLDFLCREPWFKDINATNTISTNLVAAPSTAPIGTPLAGGTMAAGTYTLAYTYSTASGETAASPSTTLAPSFQTSDFRVQTATKRAGSHSTGSALQTGMSGGGIRSSLSRGYATSRVIPQGSATVLSGANLQIAVGAVTFPTWATAVKWYIMSGPTTGFTVSNANGNAFTLNTAGNGVAPPTTSGGTATFYVTYGGSVWCEPVFSLLIPASNPNTILQVIITNAMSAESIAVNFSGGLLGGRGYTITIDSGAFQITDQAGNQYDYQGSFPMLYGPSGQVNPFIVQAVGTPANPTGLTLSATYNNRWEL